MDEILLNLVVLAAVLLLGGLIFLLVRRRQADADQKIIQLAAEKGWSYTPIREPLAWGFRLGSAAWVLEALSRSSGKETAPGSSDVSSSTTWQAPAPGSTLLIGERKTQADLGGLGDMLTRTLLQVALGADAEGLREVPAGSRAFQQQYMLWAQEPGSLRISPALESNLLHWQGVKPLIKRTSTGLVIELQGVRLKDPSRLLALVALGDLLSRDDSLRGSSTP